MELIEIDTREDWDGDEATCSHCGRKVSGSPLWIHMTTSGLFAPVSVTDEELVAAGLQSQGLFPIGSTCAKKLQIPATHYSKEA